MSDDRSPEQRLRDAEDALARLARGEEPTPEELAASPRLDFWTVVVVDGELALSGVVTGHPALDDGSHILTSALLWLAGDRSAARTYSRFYRLGVSGSEPVSSSPRLQ